VTPLCHWLTKDLELENTLEKAKFAVSGSVHMPR